MRGLKYKFTVDTFTACFLAEQETIEALKSITYKDDFFYEFRLSKLEGVGMIYDHVIAVLVQNPNDMKYMLFGYLCWSDKRQDKDGRTYVWFKVENKVFYTPLYKNVNILVFMNSITEELGLLDNNVTTLDIAYDSNTNLSKRIKRAVFNKNLTPVVNRKHYLDEKEEIPGVRFNYGTSQTRLLDISVYIKQNTKDGGFELKGYDKGKEVAGSQKGYIQDWVEMKQPFRLEVHLKKEQVQEFCAKWASFNGYLTVGALLPYLSDSKSDFLASLFYEYANRLIKFKDKNTGEVLSIFEV